MNSIQVALLAGVAAVNVLLLLAVYHKLSTLLSHQTHRIDQSADNVIAQVEALLMLYAELNPGRGLPTTRHWAASPDFLRTIATHFHQHQPAVVLECSSGISTLVLAYCVRRQGAGHVYSLEHEAVYAQRTRDLLQSHDLNNWATVIHAELKPVTLGDWVGRWYDVARLPSPLVADLLVVDGPPESTGYLARYPAMPLLHAHLSKGATVFIDDANRLDEQITVGRWLDEFSDLAAIDPVVTEKGCAVLVRSGSA